MHLLEPNGHLTLPVRMLLRAVSQAPEDLLRSMRVLPRRRNWMGFPWYKTRKGGGAFVMGDRIYVSGHFLDPRQDHTLAFLLLLAHEVGHLVHAARFGPGAMGRARFVLWAIGHYALSFIRHGGQGYRRARIEQEAERGRWVLRRMLDLTTTDPVLAQLDSPTGMTAWIHRHGAQIGELHLTYPGW